MLVKAKWNVKDAAGWHSVGEIFETSNNLGNAVEVIEPEKPKRQAPKMEPVETVEAEPKVEPKKEATSSRSASRRKNSK